MDALIVDAEESLLEARELARTPRVDELARQIGRQGEEHEAFSAEASTQIGQTGSGI